MEDILNKITTFEKAKQEWTKRGDLKMAAQFERGIKELQTELTSASSEKPIEKLDKEAKLGVARNGSFLVGDFDSDPNGNHWNPQPNSTEIKNIGGSKSEKLYVEKSPTYIEPQEIPEKKSVKKTYASWQLRQGSNFNEYQEIVNGIRDTIRTMLKFPKCDKAQKKRELTKQLEYAEYWVKENFLTEYQEMAFEKAYRIKDRKFWLDKEATLNEYFKD